MTTRIATKYRPVLTAAQIEHILLLAKSEVPISQDSYSLIVTLAPFQAKILNAAITPAYTTTPRVSSTSLEALGGVATNNFTGVVRSATNGSDQAAFLTKAEIWEAAYHKYTTNPASCSLQELRDSQEHAYLNDLMSSEELAAFESGE